MGSRDRDTRSLQDKLKVFFKKGASAALPARHELLVTAELERELGPEAPLPRRLRAARDLADRALAVRVQEGAVKQLWACTRDLATEGGAEARHAALGLLRSAAHAAGDELTLMRSVLLRHLRRTHRQHPQDHAPRFRLLHALTDNGKNIKCFEEEIGPFLLEWLPEIQSAEHVVEFLQLVTNVVKFNATYLDEEIVHGLVKNACQLLEQAAEGAVAAASLALLEAVVSYSWLPRGALRPFVAALCRAVNLEPRCRASWKLMRAVLGADIGHAALLELTALLRDAADAGRDADAGLARGAVFYTNMALWGPCRVPTLHVSFLAVLPAFRKALSGNHPVVTYEVLLAVQSLVSRVPAELDEPAWDVILDIIRAIVDQDGEYEPPNELIHSRLHALITSIEQLQDDGQYFGDPEALLALVDHCGHARPEASAMRLVTRRAAALAAAPPALALFERYGRREQRLAVRLHTLQALLGFVRRRRAAFGDELVERVATPVLGACAADADASVRAAAARALAELARAVPAEPCTDLIDLLERILSRPFDMFVTDVPVPAEADAADLRLAAAGLLDVLHDKLLAAPAAHAARCLLVLLDHLDNHYRRPALFQHHPDIRLSILEMVFGLRANAFNCVGFCYDARGAPVWGAASARLRPLCSPFLLLEGAAPAGGALLPGGRCARALVAALAREEDWAVLGGVLRALPALLQVRALCVGRRAPELDLLASTLCAMLAERAPALRERPPVSELHGAALPALAALAPYHAMLEPHTQQRIVRCLLKYGMVLRAPQPYITALTVFTLEMRDAMVKMLPEVLLDLSKISDTAAIACPMLEFLSTLTRLPRVFASFVEDQYMSVFAILLPYTNPSRYNHYVVSLAHHVIAAWFLKCRLSYRKNFVRFIIHGLHNYIILPFEEQLQYNSTHFQQGGANEDSSSRQRSSSLGSKAASRPLGGGGGASAAFHVELTEACVDLLARYASSPVSVKPRRAPAAAWLLDQGASATWLVGHRLVTVTTAGCHQNALQQGLCERCAQLCRQHAAAAPPPPAPPSAPEVKRQNSSENPAKGEDVVAQFAARIERIALELEAEEQDPGCGRVAALAARGACPCFGAGWAELHVRSPSGDASWLMRAQNQMGWDPQLESPLQEVAALLAGAPPPAAHAPPDALSSASSGLGDSRLDVGAELSPRSRSGSADSRRAPDLHKSSSDSVVSSGEAGERRAEQPPQQHRVSTQPINIPGSPQRQSSSSTTDEDDLLQPEGKCRHPVRRSNSSPEMSSWKLPAPAPAPAPPAPADMILLPSCEPASASMTLHASKKAAKKSDMRVSCEAIPEEMSGTSPHAPPHPQLLTYSSDPGAAEPPPAAPPPHLLLQKTASDSTVAKPPLPPPEDLPPLARSKRSHTISVMSPARRPRPDAAPRSTPLGGGGVTPAFVFLQLYHNMSTTPGAAPLPARPAAAPRPHAPPRERPLRVSGAQHERTVKNLDLVPPLDTYKVGVLYVGPGQQDNEVLILRNEHGSVRYAEFLAALGSLVSLLGDDERPELFLNLETGGRDGRYAYVWHDDVMQVAFHVATAMPSSPRDPTCNEKRKYIGNDFVSIVYNDSGAEFNIHTIKGQFNFCIVVVEPYEHGMTRVSVKTKDEQLRAEFLPHAEAAHVSDASAPLLARQLALHASLAAQIAQSLKLGPGAAYASNSLERLRIIKRLRRRLEAERLAAAARPAPYHGAAHHAPIAIDDFNLYT